jgi:hypothetical protein
MANQGPLSGGIVRQIRSLQPIQLAAENRFIV